MDQLRELEAVGWSDYMLVDVQWEGQRGLDRQVGLVVDGKRL